MAPAHRPHHRGIFQDAGQGQHLGLGQCAPDRRGGGNAIHHRHQQVHQHHIWGELSRQAQRLGAVCRLADHFQFRVRREERPEPLAHDRMVVNEQNANRHLRLLLEAIFALTKVVEEIHRLPDAFGVAGNYT
jgi:hypothetical protein